MSEEDETYRCRAGTDGQRCDFRGTREELSEHADEMGHPRCIVGGEVLTEFERQTCDRCANHVRDDLDVIAAGTVDLERRLREGAYSGGWLNPLAMLSNGSMDSPQTPNQYTEPRTVGPTVHIEHDEITGTGVLDDTGRQIVHSAYVEERVPSDGREHVRDHWRKDPVSVLAWLESYEREWRKEFGHGPADDLATIDNCAEYLRTWLQLAARTHPAFDEFASETRHLRITLEHVATLALDPKDDAIPCACGGKLQQHFTEKGLSDDRICRACGTVYDRDDYMWRYRLMTEVDGWVPVEKAAEKTERPIATVWAWVHGLDVPSLCHLLSRRIVVELAAVMRKSEETPRQQRRKSA